MLHIYLFPLLQLMTSLVKLASEGDTKKALHVRSDRGGVDGDLEKRNGWNGVLPPHIYEHIQ